MGINSAPVPTHTASDAGQSFCRPWRVFWFFPALAQVAGLTSFPAAAGGGLHARSQDERTKDASRASCHKFTTWGSKNKRRIASRGYARSRTLPLRLTLRNAPWGERGPLAYAPLEHRANPCHQRRFRQPWWNEIATCVSRAQGFQDLLVLRVWKKGARFNGQHLKPLAI